MPEVTLTIEPGAELEFYPSVGILVLGTLHAQGNIDRNIIMRPVKLSQVRDYRMGKLIQTHDYYENHENYENRENYENHGNHNHGKRKKRASSFKHLRITEEEDFDVRLCEANQNGTFW